MTIFENAIMYLDTLGITDVILPFALIFTVLYAILQQSGIFKGAGVKKFNVIIALVMALAVVIPHVMHTYAPEQDPINIINNIVPGSALIVVVVVIVFIVMALVMKPNTFLIGQSAIGSGVGLAALAALAIVIIKNIYPAFLPYEWLSWLDNGDVQAIIVMIAIFVIIVLYVTAEPKPTDKRSSGQRFNDWAAGLAGAAAAQAEEEKPKEP